MVVQIFSDDESEASNDEADKSKVVALTFWVEDETTTEPVSASEEVADNKSDEGDSTDDLEKKTSRNYTPNGNKLLDPTPSWTLQLLFWGMKKSEVERTLSEVSKGLAKKIQEHGETKKEIEELKKRVKMMKPKAIFGCDTGGLEIR